MEYFIGLLFVVLGYDHIMLRYRLRRQRDSLQSMKGHFVDMSQEYRKLGDKVNNSSKGIQVLDTERIRFIHDIKILQTRAKELSDNVSSMAEYNIDLANRLSELETEMRNKKLVKSSRSK